MSTSWCPKCGEHLTLVFSDEVITKPFGDLEEIVFEECPKCHNIEPVDADWEDFVDRNLKSKMEGVCVKG
jgi:uncharacterized protein with PIN domain